MLQPAIKYQEQLQNLYYDIWFNDKYKYYNADVYYNDLQVDKDTWSRHQFVSVHKNTVIGYISYSICRQNNSITGLEIINFSDKKAVFGRDVITALKDIFEKYNFRKIKFCVVIGNPIEKTYDKLIKKYGGRIVGVYKNETRLVDGKYYDEKHYEILATEYFDTKNSKSRLHNWIQHREKCINNKHLKD